MNEQTAPWSRPLFVVSAIAVGLLVVAALAIIITSSGDADTEDRGTAAAPATPTTTTASKPASGCRQPAGAQTALTSAPPDTQWELVGSMAAPTAPDTYGPGKVDKDGFRTCFAHSPTGALYAAVNFWAAGTSPGGPEVYRRLAADTPARAQAIAQTKSDSRLDAETSLQVAGFSVLSYGPAAATIDLAFRAENGGLVNFVGALRWESSDWKFVIPETGRPSGGPLRDLSAYQAWKGA